MNQYRKILTIGLSACLGIAAANAKSVPNQLIVQLRSDVPPQSLEQVNLLNTRSSLLGALQLVKTVRPNLQVVRYPTSMTAQEAARALSRDPNVVYAQPDYLMHLLDQPSAPIAEVATVFHSLLQNFGAQAINLIDPDLQNAPNLPTTPIPDTDLAKAWGLAKIGAVQAWDSIQHPAEIIVADIDTGIDYNHEDLMNNLWHNPHPTNGDLVGYDFANNDGKPYDDQGHGTHTAGTIGAVRGNGKGVSGVAPNAKLMGIKFITAAGSGTTSDAVRAIDYAVANGARVLSNSWGGYADDPDEPAGSNQALYDSVKRAQDKDVLFIAAAGNDGANNDAREELPAGMDLENIIAVASTNDQDRRSFFSNYGLTTVDVGAPGSNVYSTMVGNKYAMESGTSMACPHVAGLAALIWSARPNLKAAEVKQIIMATVDPLSTLQGKIVTGGRVNAASALRKAMTFGF